MASTGLVLAFGTGILIAVLGNVFLEPICLIAGATPTILPYAKTFIGIVFLGAPWMCSELMFVSLSQPTSLDYWRSTPTARRI